MREIKNSFLTDEWLRDCGCPALVVKESFDIQNRFDNSFDITRANKRAIKAMPLTAYVLIEIRPHVISIYNMHYDGNYINKVFTFTYHRS